MIVNRAEYISSKFPGKRFNSSGRLHALCPFHDDSSPSFSIKRDGVFICGSPKCGVRGNFAYFYKLIEGITSWTEVKEQLAEVVVVEHLDVSTLYDDEVLSSELSINPYPKFTEQISSLAYFDSRGFTQEDVADVCNVFGLRYGVSGYSSGVRVAASIVVPVYNLEGEYRTFQVRYLDPAAYFRWKNPLDSPNQDLLYGGWLLAQNDLEVWIVEGASDVWNLHRLGVASVGIFTKGASTQQKAELLKLNQKFSNLTYVVCLDSDTHSQDFGFGKDSGLDLQAELMALGLTVKLVHLHDGKDPGSLTKLELDNLEI